MGKILFRRRAVCGALIHPAPSLPTSSLSLFPSQTHIDSANLFIWIQSSGIRTFLTSGHSRRIPKRGLERRTGIRPHAMSPARTQRADQGRGQKSKQAFCCCCCFHPLLNGKVQSFPIDAMRAALIFHLQRKVREVDNSNSICSRATGEAGPTFSQGLALFTLHRWL